ncbi:HNH endonuclease signature motif containing protein [Mycobacterium malmoense]|uniref:HNH endonuclease signature motif containing protein n=1 Tax=Mycobacterium malmoense TaxID=1780 RepID=UPI0009F92F39|nr:HNH endonuclease [Mycobacterium malmoense]
MPSRSTTVRRQHRRRQPPRRCAGCGATGVRLYQDHVINLAADGPDTIANMQWLCGPCHDTKTAAERAAGIQQHHAKRYRDPEPHPGML